MNLTDELQKLADLHRNGELNDQEFTAAKHRLIANSQINPANSVAASGLPSPPKVEIEEKKYRSSRWSSGNLFFPDSLTLGPAGLLFRKGGLFSSHEENIPYRALASVSVKHGIFLSNISVETSGGSQLVYINGLWKSKAREIQEFLRTVRGQD